MTVSVCLCMCVCLSASVSRPIFTNFVHVTYAVASSFSTGVVIRYLVPVLWMTSFLHIMGHI